MMLSVLEVFSEVKDFRVNRTKKHKLLDIITIGICATIAGAEGFNAIADWAKAKSDWLKKFLDLPNGVPSHDTIRRVFGLLDPEEFQQSFTKWIASVNILLDHKFVAIDGKTLRRSFDKKNNKKALHLVSAWACDAHLSLGQIQVDEKSNEITAIPELLKILELNGAIVTLDAMGCQKKIAQIITNKKADYVLALKNNHGDLFNDVETYFKMEPQEAFHTIVTETEKDHGRIEKRSLAITKSISWLSQKLEWSNLASIACITSSRETPLGVFKTSRYYLTSLNYQESNKILKAIRGHWSIENTLHWTLDVIFNEDQSRIRDQNAAQNIALIRKMSVSMLKNSTLHQEKSLKRKKFMASLEEDYLLDLIGVKLN